MISHKLILVNLIILDIEYWRAPSRRFYIARVEEYDNVMAKIRDRRKRKSGGEYSSGSEELLLKVVESVEQVSASVR